MIQVGEYIDVGDLIDVVLKNDPTSYYRGRVIYQDDYIVVIGCKRYTDHDFEDCKLQKITTIIDREDISIIRKIEDAQTV